MAYIEDFLTNNCYRFISILLGFAFVFFTGIYDNYDRYYYLTPDQPNNQINITNDDDDFIFDINNTNLINYNNITIYRCERILNSMHFYRAINAFIYCILFMAMSCFNFKILESRKYFCNMFVTGTIINMFIGGIILISDVVYKCYDIINEQYKYMQTITIVNYLIMVLILVVFAGDTYKKNRINREIEFNNNRNVNTEVVAISKYPPKYSAYDKPPSYQENYVITISPTAPLLPKSA